MRQVTTYDELQAARAELGSLGFVPTMGKLHAGHLSLVRRAQAENDAVVVSIFVNPKQFGPNEDFDAYPRDPDGDLAKLADLGVDLVWTPGVEDIYPEGFSSGVTVRGVSEVLEGARRPGHFDGVATVVTVLFGSVRADRAYFGQKDYQQTLVVRQVVRDLRLPVEVVVCPTIREDDGLAMSSRNVYLDSGERVEATVLHRALAAVRTAFEGGEHDGTRLHEIGLEVLASDPHLELEYLSVADAHTLAELTGPVPEHGAVVSVAGRLGRTRLIDNELLG